MAGESRTVKIDGRHIVIFPELRAEIKSCALNKEETYSEIIGRLVKVYRACPQNVKVEIIAQGMASQ